MKHLKAAKKALESNDPELALDHVEDALKENPNDYFAYLYRAKSYQVLGKNNQSLRAFERATEIDPSNIVGWKGYFQAVRNTEDFGAFFKVLCNLVEAHIIEGTSPSPALKDARNYLAKHNYKQNLALYKQYLYELVPGGKLGDLIGNEWGLPDEHLINLIELEKKSEGEKVRGSVSRAKMKMPKTWTQKHHQEINDLVWSIKLNSPLPALYDQLMNVCRDDSLRQKYEQEYLRYKYEVLEVIPDKRYQEEVKKMADGMVLVRNPSYFAWSLHFDWLDLKLLSDLDEDDVTSFLLMFQHEGLGMVLYAFAMSDMSPMKLTFKSKRSEKLRRKEREEREKREKEDNEGNLEEEEKNSDKWSPDEVLSVMLAGLKKCKNSVLATRIVCNYHLHMKEYDEGTKRCKEGVQLLANLLRTHGVELPNSKEDILCSLAVIYTYHEAPKNFARAVQLYEGILAKNSHNFRAKIGRALIHVEAQDYDEAAKLFEEVLKIHPENKEAIVELAWCEIETGKHKQGRDRLVKVLETMTSVDESNMRAVTKWRIATSLVRDSIIDEAYDQLLSALKDNNAHAPSFTLLGVLYQDHYGDIERAQKCFYRAFELDANELVSAKYLVEDLAAKNQWDIAEILCQRVVNTDLARRKLLSANYQDSDKSWPYRALGCSALNKQDDSKAVEWFQSALRMKAMDTECWTGLGEAYYNCGRLDAAAKVFNHVLSLETSWAAQYMLGLVTCEMGEFEEGLDLLEQALVTRPNEECVLNALYTNRYEYSARLTANGFFGRGVQQNVRAMLTIVQAYEVNPASYNMWKVLGDCLRSFLRVQDKIEEVPVEKLAEIIKCPEEYPNVSMEKALELFHNRDFKASVAMLVILSAQCASVPKSRFLKSSIIYNVGLALLDGYNTTGCVDYRKHAIDQLKKCIQLEQGNVIYWVALGNAYVSVDPMLAQHCYIKATTLDSRDGDIWTNLAALYLRYGDGKLAEEAFARSQSLAPQQSAPWLGQALAKQILGESQAAHNLFTHAYVLANGRSSLAQLMYGLLIVAKRVEVPGSDSKNIEAAQEFSIANFAVQKFLRFEPTNEAGLKLAAVIAERCRQYTMAVEAAEKLSQILELKYENDESESTLQEIAQTKATLARLYLGLGDYAKALEAAQLALDLSDEESLVLSSRITVGLVFFLTERFAEAVDELKVILSSHGDSVRIITLTAQILYAFGSEDTKLAALDQLFNYIAEHGNGLLVVLTLAAISVVDNLQEYLEPIKDELQSLLLHELTKDTRKRVPVLLEQIDKKLSIESDVWHRNALLFPLDYNVWKHLNGKVALTVAQLKENKQTAEELAEAHVANNKLRQLQRAVMLCPGLPGAREAIQLR